MSYKKAILGLALLAVMAGAANAATNTFGITGGMGIPNGDWSDATNKGWQLGATGTHMVNQQWGFGGDVVYHAWGGSDLGNAAMQALTGDPSAKFKMSAIQATAHALMAFPTTSNVKPYAKVGAGLYNVDQKVTLSSVSSSVSAAKFGFNFGGGVNFLTKSNMTWGLNGAYHIVPAKNDPKVGADVNFFQVGLDVLWGTK